MGRQMVARILMAAGLGALVVMPAAAPAQNVGNDAETRFAAGLVHLREGRADLAVDEFKKAIKGDEKNAYYLKGLGQAYAQQRKFKDAIEAFRKSLRLNPYYVDVRNDLGMALVLSGKREEGRKEFLSAFSDPTNPTPEISSRNLAQSYLEEKNYAEAIHWFRTSIVRNKIYADPYLGLADALIATGRTEEAVAALEGGVKEAPADPSLLTGLGEVLLKAGRFTEARARLEAAVQKDPAGVWGRRAAEVLKTVPK
ncbi:MAG TPA: tetratricopeptide repeat protein [Vicinamibacteria bacterium]|nr:tetratricopeptide repeat protein [Vicinamibacteria bacterium]